MWCGDVGVIQRVHDAGVIFTKRQVFYQMGHVNLQDKKTHGHPANNNLTSCPHQTGWEQEKKSEESLTLSKPKLCRSCTEKQNASRHMWRVHTESDKWILTEVGLIDLIGSCCGNSFRMLLH